MSSYIERSLGEGERIVCKARFHWWYTVKTVLWACTIIGLIVAIPSMIFYRFFRGRVDAYLVEMEQQAVRLVEIVHGERK